MRAKLSVRVPRHTISRYLLGITGRVAAGAIAERYLKFAYGVEIVAFVTSVGKIHLPVTDAASSVDDDNDDAPEPMSEEFRKLLATVSREEVDKHPTRCPHPETAERMKKVRLFLLLPVPRLIFSPSCSASSVPRMLQTRSAA